MLPIEIMNNPHTNDYKVVSMNGKLKEWWRREPSNDDIIKPSEPDIQHCQVSSTLTNVQWDVEQLSEHPQNYYFGTWVQMTQAEVDKYNEQWAKEHKASAAIEQSKAKQDEYKIEELEAYLEALKASMEDSNE